MTGLWPGWEGFLGDHLPSNLSTSFCSFDTVLSASVARVSDWKLTNHMFYTKYNLNKLIVDKLTSERVRKQYVNKTRRSRSKSRSFVSANSLQNKFNIILILGAMNNISFHIILMFVGIIMCVQNRCNCVLHYLYINAQLDYMPTPLQVTKFSIL